MKAWYLSDAGEIDEHSRRLAQEHNARLTKPLGSLGRLESLVIDLAGLQAVACPVVKKVAITIFAADHGVADEGVSAFPQVVTEEMIRNFSKGGAAICVLANHLDASFSVVNVGTVRALESMHNVLDRRVACGTNNFSTTAAMSAEQCQQALSVGREAVEALKDVDLFIGGEMGIANTCTASALASALLAEDPLSLVGQGTGVDSNGVQLKARIISKALKLHGIQSSPLSLLELMGGFEIAALIGAYIAAAQRSIAVLVDGFICSVAASVAVAINPSIRPWLLFSHQSAEAGHQRLLQSLGANPLLQLDLRLGEGSGAAIAVPLIKMACEMHQQMASFDAAGVSVELGD